MPLQILKVREDGISYEKEHAGNEEPQKFQIIHSICTGIF